MKCGAVSDWVGMKYWYGMLSQAATHTGAAMLTPTVAGAATVGAATVDGKAEACVELPRFTANPWLTPDDEVTLAAIERDLAAGNGPSALGKRPLRKCVECTLTGGGPLSGAKLALGGPRGYRPSPLGSVTPSPSPLSQGPLPSLSSAPRPVVDETAREGTREPAAPSPASAALPTDMPERPDSPASAALPTDTPQALPTDMSQRPASSCGSHDGTGDDRRRDGESGDDDEVMTSGAHAELHPPAYTDLCTLTPRDLGADRRGVDLAASEGSASRCPSRSTVKTLVCRSPQRAELHQLIHVSRSSTDGDTEDMGRLEAAVCASLRASLSDMGRLEAQQCAEEEHRPMAAGAVPMGVELRDCVGDAEELAIAAAGGIDASVGELVRVHAAAGAIAPLVELTRSGSAAAKLMSAEALFGLTNNNTDNQVAVAETGGAGPLVELMRSGTAAAKTAAARVLWNLTTDDVISEVAIVAEGGIAPLVELTRSGTAGAAEAAAGALMNLVSNHARAIVAAGGIVALFELARCGTARAKTYAVRSCHRLAAANAANAVAIKEAAEARLVVELGGGARAEAVAAAALADVLWPADLLRPFARVSLSSSSGRPRASLHQSSGSGPAPEEGRLRWEEEGRKDGSGATAAERRIPPAAVARSGEGGPSDAGSTPTAEPGEKRRRL